MGVSTKATISFGEFADAVNNFRNVDEDAPVFIVINGHPFRVSGFKYDPCNDENDGLPLFVIESPDR